MLELIINKEKNDEIIALVENGRLLEFYKENNQENRREGNIYAGVVKDVIEGMQSAFVDIGAEKNSFIHIKDILPKIDERKEKYDETAKISGVVKRNDKILVQVKKDSSEKKGARISTHISLTSKFIVYMPNTTVITISQKIESEKEKNRLQDIVKKNISKGNGAIIRTSAEGKSEQEIIEDIKNVENKWNKILDKYNKECNNACLIVQGETIEEKIIIDLFGKLNKIIVNDKKNYKKIKEILDTENIKNIPLELKENQNVLDVYDLEKQISKTEERKVWLRCGGFITIDKTEALTAIDVNSGKYTGKKSLEDTIYKVNEEATMEIAKQLRLRDIGGIIIIDYIDMQKIENKDKIENLLKQCLKEDRAKTQVEGFTKLDLMELTRKHIATCK